MRRNKSTDKKKENKDDGGHNKEEDTISDKVKTIEPTSGTDTYRPEDELIMSVNGKAYEDTNGT